MNKWMGRAVSLALALVMLLTLGGCGSKTVGIMEGGAEQFGQGKDEESYSLKNSGALLDELIDHYSGSYDMPTGTRMDDSAYDDARRKLDDTSGDPRPEDGTDPDSDDPGDGSEGTDPEDGSEDPDSETGGTSGGMAEVSNWDELLRVFHDAYDATAESLQFRVVDGFTVDLSQDLQQSFNDLQRMDPIDVCSVASWTWGTNGTDEYLVQIAYRIDVEELIAMKEATAGLVDEAVERIDVTGLSDYEIVCAVNEYLCDTVEYPDAEPYAAVTHTAYGAFENGIAVCEGYACAAKLLLNAFGIQCDIQVGTCTNGGGHAWNLIYLDGEWYQADFTWNDASASRTDYLLVTDAYMQKSRTWNTGDYPACAAQAYTP